MKFSLSLENFRKFENLQPLNCNDITFLVGPNGSGKSSFTKALLLVLSNFDNPIEIEHADVDASSLPLVHFKSVKYGNLHIDRFSRAIFNRAHKKQITLCLSTYGSSEGNINTYKLSIKNSDTEKDLAVISKIEICSHYKGRVELIIDYEEKLSAFHLFDENGKMLVEKQVNMPGSKYSSASESINDLSLKNIIKDLEDIIGEGSVFGLLAASTMMIFPWIGGIFAGAAIYKKRLKEEKKTNYDLCDGKIRDAYTALSKIQIDYVYVHYIEQNYLFGGKKKDFLSDTIVNFYSLGCMKSSEIRSFILKWMDVDHFKIGEDFQIREGVSSGTFYFDIIDNKKKMPLADKGVGQIQIMILLMRIGIAKLIYEKRKKSIEDIKAKLDAPVIIIEEPEQNMHPNMQSKLADLFYDAHSNFNIGFLIETHSEYLIRRSQVLVSRMCTNHPHEHINENPFKVIYFPEDGEPYDMQFKQNGFFVRSFMPGFIDEAGKWQMELLTNKSHK